jgi:peptide/nickel transport system permease protein
MTGYALRRVLGVVPVMAVVALFVFGLLYVAGDPAAVLAGDKATPEQVDHIRVTLGLDQPFFIRFGNWVWRVLHGDLGTSIYTDQSVLMMIGQRVEPTLGLVVLTMIISIGVAVPLGVVAAWKRGTFVDRATMVLSVLGFSVPVFVLGYVLAYWLAVRLDWLPAQGYAPLRAGLWAFLRHLILPASALGLAYIALIARITRASMLEVLSQDYLRTARAKGVLAGGVLFRHALKNAANPIVTVIGVGVATLIGGTVVTETVFAIPGLGRLTVDAIAHRDYPVIQGVVLLFSAAFVLVNLATDLLYRLFDPRIRY